MTPERWQAVERLYHAALASAPHERAAFLIDACAGDDALRQAVDALLTQRGRGVGRTAHADRRMRDRIVRGHVASGQRRHG